LTEDSDHDEENYFSKTYLNLHKEAILKQKTSILTNKERHHRTSIVVFRKEESTKIGDITFKDLSQIIQNIMLTSQSNTGAVQNYTIAPRPKYHLVNLKSYTGKTEDYPTWRQNLEICLERETFKDDKDKALFVLNHLTGTPYLHCKYYVRKLTDRSFKNMMIKLDRNYRSTEALDMSLILIIYKLPKLNYLTKDMRDHQIETKHRRVLVLPV